MLYQRAKLFEIQEIIYKYSRYKYNASQQVYFLQIGSGDGVTHDPLYQSIVTLRWSGCFVEPVPYMFEQLKANYLYEDLDLVFVNTGIHNQKKSQQFYYLRENIDHLPYWYNQLASFDKELIISHQSKIPSIEQYIVSAEVSWISVPELIEKYNIKDLTLLHIDAEGYDLDILESFPFDLFKLELILFESKHINTIRLEKVYQKYSLQYSIIHDDDTLLVHKSIIDKL